MTSSIAPDRATVAAQHPTAAIIPFPSCSKPAEPNPRQRLALALDTLNAALADQRTAVAAWRGVLMELRATTTALDESLQRYRSNLRSLSGSVSSLNAKARSLAQWADSVSAG